MKKQKLKKDYLDKYKDYNLKSSFNKFNYNKFSLNKSNFNKKE